MNGQKITILPRVYSAPRCCRDNSWSCQGSDNSWRSGNSNNRPGLHSNSDPGGGEVVSAAVVHHNMMMVPDHTHTALVAPVAPVTRVQDCGHVSHLMGHVHSALRGSLPDHDNASPDPGPAMMATSVSPVLIVLVMV